MPIASESARVASDEAVHISRGKEGGSSRAVPCGSQAAHPARWRASVPRRARQLLGQHDDRAETPNAVGGFRPTSLQVDIVSEDFCCGARSRTSTHALIPPCQAAL